jgi:hypothetical protein
MTNPSRARQVAGRRNAGNRQANPSRDRQVAGITDRPFAGHPEELCDEGPALDRFCFPSLCSSLVTDHSSLLLKSEPRPSGRGQRNGGSHGTVCVPWAFSPYFGTLVR